MYNKELFEKIVDVKCTFKELEAFVTEIDKKEFDIDNAFNKYYNVDKILMAIDRYKNKEIDAKFLACWMNAYNWIIMAGFKIESKDKEIAFKDLVVWEISDWLDSLSFFDDSDDWFNLEDYKHSFKIIDSVYKSINDWHCVFAHTDEWGDNEDDVVLLAINNKTKQFVKIYASLDYLNEKVTFPKIEENKIIKEIERLKCADYQELKYGFFDEIEE